MVGSLGGIINFEVSSETVLTFSNLKRTTTGRWATHNVIGRKPVAEFLGPGLASITMDIYLSSAHGVRPRRTLNLIDIAVENGTPFRFVVGPGGMGTYRWVITNASKAWNQFLNRGELVSANVTLTLQEYYEKPE